ncbi:MAG: hypothetical protein AAB071_00040 [Bacteroidota bacterium]
MAAVLSKLKKMNIGEIVKHVLNSKDLRKNNSATIFKELIKSDEFYTVRINKIPLYTRLSEGVWIVYDDDEKKYLDENPKEKHLLEEFLEIATTPNEEAIFYASLVLYPHWELYRHTKFFDYFPLENYETKFAELPKAKIAAGYFVNRTILNAENFNKIAYGVFQYIKNNATTILSSDNMKSTIEDNFAQAISIYGDGFDKNLYDYYLKCDNDDDLKGEYYRILTSKFTLLSSYNAAMYGSALVKEIFPKGNFSEKGLNNVVNRMVSDGMYKTFFSENGRIKMPKIDSTDSYIDGQGVEAINMLHVILKSDIMKRNSGIEYTEDLDDFIDPKDIEYPQIPQEIIKIQAALNRRLSSAYRNGYIKNDSI